VGVDKLSELDLPVESYVAIRELAISKFIEGLITVRSGYDYLAAVHGRSQSSNI
jgi:hypothetical protein